MYNLLIADDKDIFRRMIIRMPYFRHNEDKFCIKGLAQNGLEALELLNTEDIDIVLTDIRMPIMNGIELLKTISKNKLCKCTILLSEYSDFSYAKEGIINGAFDYIVKPVDDNKLKHTFDRAYEYMQGFVDKNDMFFNSIKKLANSILSDDETLLFIKLSAVTESIKANSDSFSEMLVAVNFVLEELLYQILAYRPYFAHYIPLETRLTLNSSVHDESELIQLFHKKVIMTRNELEKFNISTPCHLINGVWHYAIENIESIGGLQQIAEKFYVNKKYLSALFKKETGMRYIDFITYFKIERAKMLLNDPHLKIYNIAELLGFADTEYFSKVFKKQTGITPSSFSGI